MKKILQFLLLYIILVVTIVNIFITTIQLQEKQLEITTNQLSGVDYLKSIYNLSISVANYMEYLELSLANEKIKSSKKRVLLNIEKIYAQQEKNPLFINEALNTKLEAIKTFKMTEESYFEFLNSINHENYVIGDKSELLFEENRELYFLGSLITHYMPEYLISTQISHNIIEELKHNSTLSDEKKHIFIEQNKLLFLSSEEISGILKALSPYSNTHKLQYYNSQIIMHPIN